MIILNVSGDKGGNMKVALFPKNTCRGIKYCEIYSTTYRRTTVPVDDGRGCVLWTLCYCCVFATYSTAVWVQYRYVGTRSTAAVHYCCCYTSQYSTPYTQQAVTADLERCDDVFSVYNTAVRIELLYKYKE